jgi:hypothetical protein
MNLYETVCINHELYAEGLKFGYVHVFEVMLGKFNVDKICTSVIISSKIGSGFAVAVGGGGSSKLSNIIHTQKIYSRKQCKFLSSRHPSYDYPRTQD